MLTQTQIGILRDIAANKVGLDDCGEWMREQLCELVLHEPMLIDTMGPSVFLTKAGSDALKTAESS